MECSFDAAAYPAKVFGCRSDDESATLVALNLCSSSGFTGLRRLFGWRLLDICDIGLEMACIFADIHVLFTAICHSLSGCATVRLALR